MIEAPRRVVRSLLLVSLLVAGGAGCNLFAPGTNPLGGTGIAAMDPYMGRPSGAIRLGLQLYNGCGVLGNGSSTGRGNTNFEWPYPANCTDLNSVRRASDQLPPMAVVTGVPYFLDQLTIADVVNNLHTDPKDTGAPLKWIEKESRFKHLDWENTSMLTNEWEPDRAALGGFTREVRYGNAAWMSVEHDSFLVEILDADGNVVASMDYPRDSFRIDNPVGGHSQFTWRVGVVGKPEFLGDTRINAVPAQPVGGAVIRPPSFRTMARLDLTTQARPFDRTFTIPEDLRGDGVARVTWTQLPDEPFYFPLTFTHPNEPDFPQCWKKDDPSEQVPCDFGAQPYAVFSAPRNGAFYEPGEVLQMKVSIEDGLGNLIHPPDSFPTYNEFLTGRSNGLLYGPGPNNSVYGERNVWTSMTIQGPIHLMRPSYGGEGGSPWFSQYGRGSIPNSAAANNSRPGSRDIPGETSWPIELPEDAQPGTYVAYVKVNRQFMGERLARTGNFFFQVGQKEKTKYPERVGNCAICHIGPTSLINISMGMDSANVEGCKSCHGNLAKIVHQVHMLSKSFPHKKHDCTICHLTRESTLTPRLSICNSCHTAHAAQYFDQSFAGELIAPPNQNSACGNTCHTSANPPSQHIVPPERKAP